MLAMGLRIALCHVLVLAWISQIQAASDWDNACGSAESVKLADPHAFPKFSLAANFSEPDCIPGGTCRVVFDLQTYSYRSQNPSISKLAVFAHERFGRNVGTWSLPDLVANKGLTVGCNGGVVTHQSDQEAKTGPFLLEWRVPPYVDGSEKVQASVVFDGIEQILNPIEIPRDDWEEFIRPAERPAIQGRSSIQSQQDSSDTSTTATDSSQSTESQSSSGGDNVQTTSTGGEAQPTSADGSNAGEAGAPSDGQNGGDGQEPAEGSGTTAQPQPTESGSESGSGSDSGSGSGSGTGSGSDSGSGSGSGTGSESGSGGRSEDGGPVVLTATGVRPLPTLSGDKFDQAGQGALNDDAALPTPVIIGLCIGIPTLLAIGMIVARQLRK